MEQKKVLRDYKVLTEKISPDNVAEMAELIAMRETRALIGFMGYHAEKAHKQLCRDIFGKNEPGYTISDNYDLVQSVALFLCNHYEKYLDDVLYISKKGKQITIKMDATALSRGCCPEITEPGINTKALKSQKRERNPNTHNR